MQGPKLRTVNKVRPPYEMNKFPHKFVERFGEEIVYMLATKPSMSIEGNEWEAVFARCAGAEWKPSNVGLDDVVMDSCCWSAKTVKGSKNLASQKNVRLISGRNSPNYSFDAKGVSTDSDPSMVGKMVLDIWNERVSAVRSLYKFARTVVLVKGKNYDEYLIFELETVRYEADCYEFSWNKNGNLEGRDKETGEHRFTWQPHGSQLTIIEDIPDERLHIRVRVPERLDTKKVLEAVGFSHGWVTEVETGIKLKDLLRD